MTPKDFWNKSTVAVIGGGSWGTVLAALAARNCASVRVWVRSEEQARALNSTKSNPDYVEGLQLPQNIQAHVDLERIFGSPAQGGGVQGVIWALPSAATREQARRLAPHFRGDEIVLHATKGVEEGTLKRISEVLGEEIPCPRIGVISGPNLADEIARNEPAATVVASAFAEVITAGQVILGTDRFRVYGAADVVGVEWAGVLKNILAIAAGVLDSLGFGANSRAMLVTRGLAEMVRFGAAMGADPMTFLGLAGVGDLLATCSSPLSRNYRVGHRLGKGEKLEAILESLGSTAEGVKTTRAVHEFARSRGISMPITEAVYHLLQGGFPVGEIVQALMKRTPVVSERG